MLEKKQRKHRVKAPERACVHIMVIDSSQAYQVGF
jgi:hypothetical protein